jgi:hypothetical protein
MRFVGLLLLAACSGAEPPTYTVGGNKLTVLDSGYLTSGSGQFCAAMSPLQIQLRFVDYEPICGSDPKVATARDPKKAHSELQIVLGIGGHVRNADPYVAGKIDCGVGPGMPALGTWLHWPANAGNPDVSLQADSGSINLDAYDPTDKNPVKGRFTLQFGANTLKGSFDTFTCN